MAEEQSFYKDHFVLSNAEIKVVENDKKLSDV